VGERPAFRASATAALQGTVRAADGALVLETIPQAKAMWLLALATLLTLVATTALRVALEPSRPGHAPVPVVSSGSSPGASASARLASRLAVGR
jgi:hypothetical protein